MVATRRGPHEALVAHRPGWLILAFGLPPLPGIIGPSIQSMLLVAGTRLGLYEILAAIGKGGMGEVSSPLNSYPSSREDR